MTHKHKWALTGENIGAYCPDCDAELYPDDILQDIFDDGEVKLKDRLILGFGDVKKCLLELEERIDELEKEHGAGITTFKTVRDSS